MNNYFELYGLPQSFHPDQATVKAKYRDLSRTLHPDRHITATPEVQADMLRQTATNNEAYKTLTSPDRTMAHILHLHSLLEEEEKYTLPPAFLMEMMDLNEAISDYEDNPQGNLKDKATSDLNDALTDWQTAITPLLQQFDSGNQSTTLLQQVKDYYFRKKYLLRIQDRLNTFAAAQ